MSNTAITYLVAAVAGVACIVLWIWLIAAPAWTAFSRLWERLLAIVMSVYVLVALLALGGAVAAAGLWYYEKIG